MKKGIIIIRILAVVVGAIGAATGNDSLLPIGLGLLMIGMMLYFLQLNKKKQTPHLPVADS